MTRIKADPPKSKRATDHTEDEDENAKPEAEKVEKEGKESVRPDKEPTSEPATKKRKTTSKTAAKDHPGSRRATRSAAKTASATHESKAIIQFMLSDDAVKLLDQLGTDDADGFQFPRDRYVGFQDSRGLCLRCTCWASLNPFQDLVAACMVSKPFSHRVATRAINDLFREENSLTSPQAVLDFGHDKVYVWGSLVSGSCLPDPLQVGESASVKDAS